MPNGVNGWEDANEAKNICDANENCNLILQDTWASGKSRKFFICRFSTKLLNDGDRFKGYNVYRKPGKFGII